MWLRDECDGTIYFPEPDSAFDLHSLPEYATLVVEEPTATGLNARAGFSPITPRGQQVVASATGSATSSQGSSLPPAPIFRSVVASKKVTVSIKIFRARLILSRKNKKPDFETIGQTYVEVTETTAKVVNIKQTVLFIFLFIIFLLILYRTVQINK